MPRNFPAVILFLFIVHFTNAQMVDQTFKMPLVLKGADISDVLVQPDGKILVGGDIRYVGGKKTGNVIRLNIDGTLDETFNFPIHGRNYEYPVQELRLQSDGDIVYKTRGGTIGIVSLTGEEKANFETSQWEGVNAICVQGDDKIVAALAYQNMLLRLNADGTRDETFINAVTANGIIYDIEYFDNHLILSGSFSQINSITKNDIARVNLDGSVDLTFDTGSGTNDVVIALGIQPDGKIIPCRTYINTYNGEQTIGVIRINQNGSRDTGFVSPSTSSSLTEVAFQNGKILIGQFSNMQILIQRLNSNGSLDGSFNPINLSSLDFQASIAVSADSEIYLSSTQNFGSHYGLNGFSPSGTHKATFSPEVATHGTVSCADIYNDKIMAGGDFLKVGDHMTYGLVKLHLDGSLDKSFQQRSYTGNEYSQIDIVDDQYFLATDFFHFAKFDFSGNVAPDFKFSPFKHLYGVSKFLVLGDGKIIVADGNDIQRLNADGTEDPGYYDVGPGTDSQNGRVVDIVLQSGKVLYGFASPPVNGSATQLIVRLNENGQIDPTFSIGTGPDFFVNDINLLPDNQVLVTGSFRNFNGVPTPMGIVKLTANGAVAPTFLSNFPSLPPIKTVSVTSDRILIGGYAYSGFLAMKFDGTLDTDFVMPSIISTYVVRNFLRSGDNLFVLGELYMNGQPDPFFITRIFPGKTNDIKPVITATSVSVMVEDTPRTFTTADFSITDPDNTSNVFYLTLLNGPGYTVSEGNKLRPSANFNGMLTAQVRVSDGLEFSDVFVFQINVTPVNDRPMITNVRAGMKIIDGVPLEIFLDDIKVADPDNKFPSDFTFQILNGPHYTVADHTIICDSDFLNGKLEVNIIVNDGFSDSNPYHFQVDVMTILDIGDEASEVGMMLFPNPSKTDIQLNYKGVDQASKIIITDAAGRPIEVKPENTGNNYRFDTSSLPPGIYFMKLVLKDKVAVKKFIKSE